ncbi:glycosyltransferase family 4 protein [Sphingobium amiense]|nr:glycosyltransferase family 4 protein [Sphingobium amiense]
MKRGALCDEVPGVGHIALIGNSVPRRCGIATFTTHCHDAMKQAFPSLRIDLYAMDNGADGIVYPDNIHVIAQDDVAAYSEAAARIEDSGAKAIWLQHEFGIFGGPAGDLILRLLDRTKLPLVVTLHTISDAPSADERRVMDQILRRASRIIVMAGRGRDILISDYGVDPAIVAVIPHGVPDRPYVEPATMKPRFGWDGHKVILTFGLLAPDKGIDQMIRAMPAVVAAHPDALYVIMGATHPNLVREQGERLRDGLKTLAAQLGVAGNIRFVDTYIEQEELLDFLQAADIYVTPYVNPAQVVSGTLSYALGMGKPVVSTPYVQAIEVLAEERGVVVPFRDPKALGLEIVRLLSDDAVLDGHARRAYACGRAMIWSELAHNVGGLLSAACAGAPARFSPRRSYALLKPDIRSIVRMSDSTGMLQHGILSVPDRNHGYCIDDNARALMLMVQATEVAADERDRWSGVYAAFIQHGWNPDIQRFRNFMSFDRRWLEEKGSEDSNGRTLWALGVTMREAAQTPIGEWARRLFNTAVEPLSALGSPRARAFAMLGAAAVLEVDPDHRAARTILTSFADALMALPYAPQPPSWVWFEDVLAYDNARLPEALLRAGRILKRDDMIRRGLSRLRWLCGQQRSPEGHFRAVGSESFGRPGKPPLPYDQQPLEALATVEAAIAAHAVDPKGGWLAQAESAYRWFLGQNDLDTPLATPFNQGCYDGLTPGGPNLNQGAESLLALQLASCAMNRIVGLLSGGEVTHNSDKPSVSA